MTVRFQGALEGLEVTVAESSDGIVEPGYQLKLGGQTMALEDLIGCGVRFTHMPPDACVHCAKPVSKLYGGGHCYDCFSTLARCDLCVVSPDRCHYASGTCREPEWGEAFCMQPHSVYLAVSSGPKVGLTRRGRELRRWVDQGASAAMVIAHTPSRRAAGVVEAQCRRFVSDRTDWRKLVSGTTQSVDLADLARILRREIPELSALQASNVEPAELAASVWLTDTSPSILRYPVTAFSPAERLVVNAEHVELRDNLQGAVGQFLLFSRGAFNVAEHRGIGVVVEIDRAFSAAEISNNEQMSLF